MRRDEVRDALDAMASQVPAPTTDAAAAMTRGRRLVRQRRLALAGVVALLVAIVVGAGAIARSDDGTPRVASVPTTVHTVEVVPQTTTTTTPARAQPTRIPLAFVSPTEGWLCSDPMRYTTDAGRTFTEVHLPTTPADEPSSQPRLCAATAGGNAWVLSPGASPGHNQLTWLSEGGRTKETFAFRELLPDVQVQELTFLNPFVGWARATASDGTTDLLTTFDSGRTWRMDRTTKLHAIKFTSSSEGWAARTPSQLDALLIRTRDGGRNWEPVRVPAPIRLGDFLTVAPVAVEGDTVIAEGYDPTGNDTSVFFVVSTDGGRTWALRSGPTDRTATPPIVFSATDADHWQLARSNRLWTTSDRGATWMAVAEFAGFSAITDVDFLTPEIGFVSARGEGDTSAATEVLQTNDGGENWSMVIEDSPPMSEDGPINFPGGIFGCPTHPLATPPPGNPPAGLVDAATRWVEDRGGTVATIDATYPVGEKRGSFWEVFNFQIPSCGSEAVAASWVVEMHGPIGQGGGGSTDQSQVVLAYAPDGWHAYGRYH